MLESKLSQYFSGLSATISSIKAVQKIYDPLMAFNFNSFNFWKVGENKTSEILAYFLDPNNAHGQGRVFLDIFLNCIGLNQRTDLYGNVSVCSKCELVIDDSRRIDIIITFGKDFAIAIENKIGAPDQPNQLKDYNNYLQEKYGSNYLLIYLNPWNESHTDISLDLAASRALQESGHLKLMGYTDHIIDCVHQWSLHCRAERVRSFLTDFEQHLRTQYLNETFMEENDTVAKYALKSPENLEMAFSTANAINTIKENLITTFLQQMQKLADKNKLKFDPNLSAKEINTKMSFYHESWKHFRICFEFESKNYDNLFYGLLELVDNQETTPSSLNDEVLKRFNLNSRHSEWYIWLDREHFELSYRNWSNSSQPWLDIQSGDIVDKIEQPLQQLLAKLDGLEL